MNAITADFHNTSPDINLGEAPVLRVLGGPDLRQSNSLSSGIFSIGYDYTNDIVLRDRRVAGIRVTLSFEEDNVAELQIIEGEVDLLGQTLRSPARLLLPPYTPLSLGGLYLAFGDPLSSRWYEAERLCNVLKLQIPSLELQTTQAVSSEAIDGVGTGRQSFFATSRLIAPLVLCALAIGFLVTTLLDFRLGQANLQPPSSEIRHLLKEGGFGNLKVSQGMDGKPVISGTLAAPQNITRLESLLQSRGLSTRLNLTGTSEFVQKVQDIFRSAGVDCRISVGTGNTLSVWVKRGEDPALVDSLRRQALRIAPNLISLNIAFSDALSSDVQGGVRADAIEGQRIVSMVPGDGGYLSDANGTKYFPGALLPTGQTLERLDNNSIVFKMDNSVTTINF